MEIGCTELTWLVDGNEPSTPPPPPLALAPDEAVISSHYMLQLINYCFRSYDPNWDEDDAENMQRVEEMAAVSVGLV
jgi:hypothetical protein